MAVGVGERRGDRALCEAGHLVEHGARGVGVQVPVTATGQDVAQRQHLEEVELDVTHIGDVVARRMCHSPECGGPAKTYATVTCADLR